MQFGNLSHRADSQMVRTLPFTMVCLPVFRVAAVQVVLFLGVRFEFVRFLLIQHAVLQVVGVLLMWLVWQWFDSMRNCCFAFDVCIFVLLSGEICGCAKVVVLMCSLVSLQMSSNRVSVLCVVVVVVVVVVDAFIWGSNMREFKWFGGWVREI